MFCPNLEPLFALCLLGYCRRWLCNMVEGRKGWPTDDWLQIACSKGRPKDFLFYNACIFSEQPSFYTVFPMTLLLVCFTAKNNSFYGFISTSLFSLFFNIQSVSVEFIFSFDDSLHSWVETCFKRHDWIKHIFIERNFLRNNRMIQLYKMWYCKKRLLVFAPTT